MKKLKVPDWCKHIKFTGDGFQYRDREVKIDEVYKWRCCPICKAKPVWER